MKKFTVHLDDIIPFKVKEEGIKYLESIQSEVFEGNIINCKVYELIPLFYEFCIQNPGVELLYNFEYVEVEVVLSHYGRDFLSQKQHSLNMYKIGDKEIIKCKFNELVRIFGEYYDKNYYTIYNPFLYNEIKLYINK